MSSGSSGGCGTAAAAAAAAVARGDCCRLCIADVKTVKQQLSAKLHYTDTGYGHVVQHHQRTSSKLTTILQLAVQQICHIAMPEPNISTCPDVGMWQIFVRRW